jgi:hypothetical protein
MTDSPMTDTAFPAEFDALAALVDQCRERVAHQPAEVRALLGEAIATITEFNRRGLVELVHLVRSDPRGEELLFEAVDRPEVMALLVTHGIVRTDRTLDVLRVVESIRPYLVTSSIQMDVDRVEGDTAYVRFAGGCSAPSREARDEIMGVIRQRVPGLASVVEVSAEPGPAFVPLTSLRIGP